MNNEERRHPNVINLDEVEPRELSQGSKFGATLKSLGIPHRSEWRRL